MALTEGTRLGSYVIAARIGAGGMGEVHRARDTRLGRDVAIKTLPMPTGAGEPRRLERQGLTILGAKWLPDGQRVVARAQESARNTRLYLFDLDRGTADAMTRQTSRSGRRLSCHLTGRSWRCSRTSDWICILSAAVPRAGYPASPVGSRQAS